MSTPEERAASLRAALSAYDNAVACYQINLVSDEVQAVLDAARELIRLDNAHTIN